MKNRSKLNSNIDTKRYTLTRLDVNNINCVAYISGNVVTLHIYGGNNIELATKNSYAYVGTLPNGIQPHQDYIKNVDYISFKGQLTIRTDGSILIGYTDINIPKNCEFWATETFVI